MGGKLEKFWKIKRLETLKQYANLGEQFEILEKKIENFGKKFRNMGKFGKNRKFGGET